MITFLTRLGLLPGPQELINLHNEVDDGEANSDEEFEGELCGGSENEGEVGESGVEVNSEEEIEHSDGSDEVFKDTDHERV